jgi:hypothetical protein
LCRAGGATPQPDATNSQKDEIHEILFTPMTEPFHISRARPREALFPSFFGAGFECSTHMNREGRQDLVAQTQHDRFLCDDYARIEALGLLTVREGVPWHHVARAELGGGFDFSTVDQIIDAAQEFGLTIIWDLFHYGYPDHLDPFSERFIG